MIRINLLPFRLARKKENIRRQVSVFLLSIVFIGVLLFWLTLSMNNKITETNARIASVKAEITRYKAKADRVAQIKMNLKLLEDKLKIVASLKTRRNEQQVLLEEMADKTVQTRMWIESLTANESTVTVAGVAFDNPTIADFMRNLEQSPLFSSVDLKRSKIRTFQGDVDLKAFELQCTKRKPKPASPAKGGKK